MKRLLTGSVAGVLLAAVNVLSAPAAAAAPVDKTIAYDCDIPIFGTKTLNIEMRVDLPATGTVGSPIQLRYVTVIVPIPHDVYDTFTPFGATQVDASLAFGFDIGGVSVPVDFSAPRTPIPNPSGPDLLLAFSGPVPPVTPGQTGTVSVAASRSFAVQLIPRDAAGNTTILGSLNLLGTTTADTTLGSVTVS